MIISIKAGFATIEKNDECTATKKIHANIKYITRRSRKSQGLNASRLKIVVCFSKGKSPEPMSSIHRCPALPKSRHCPLFDEAKIQ